MRGRPGCPAQKEVEPHDFLYQIFSIQVTGTCILFQHSVHLSPFHVLDPVDKSHKGEEYCTWPTFVHSWNQATSRLSSILGYLIHAFNAFAHIYAFVIHPDQVKKSNNLLALVVSILQISLTVFFLSAPLDLRASLSTASFMTMYALG